MKKNLIRAYSAINLGDDLFIKILCDRYPDHQFYIISSKLNSTPFLKIPNLTVIYRPRYIDGILAKLQINFKIENLLSKYYAKKLDSVIHIGGSIFMEHGDWESRAEVYESIVEISKKFIIMGSNFGPFNNPRFLNKYSSIFEEVDALSFRDEYSYELFPQLTNTRLAPDIVFSLPENDVNQIEREKYMVVSVLDLSWRTGLSEYQQKYEQAIIDISKRLNNQGINVVLMSFCEAEGDEQAINRILEDYKNDRINAYYYRGDLDESLTVIKSSIGVIATRFHSMILGWVFNKPVFPFIYSKKTSNVLNDSKDPGYSLPISEIDRIDYDKVIEQLTNKEAQDISIEKEEALKHFFETDKFLSN